MPEKPLYFDRCFNDEIKNGKLFGNYMKIISNGVPEPAKNKPEKHHIIPREWLVWKFRNFNADIEDKNNVTYLSVRDKLFAMQYLVLMFLEMKDGETYKRLTRTMARRYHLGWYEFWKNPYIENGMVSFLVEKRKQEFMNRKRKYSDDYLRKCQKILDGTGNKDEAFETVKEQMGFKYKQKTLLDQIKNRFGQHHGK